MENVINFISMHGPTMARGILRLVSIVFFLYGFSLLAEGTETLRNATHPIAPSVSQATSTLAIGFLLLSALLWAAGS